MAHDNSIENIIATLETASESLNDVAMSLIREALAQGAGQRPPLEKRVSQARRAVDKATQILKGNEFNID